MKTALIGLAFVLSSTSIVLNEDKVYTEDVMTSLDEKQIISGEEMVVRTGLITETKKLSDCNSTKCWSQILKKVKK